MTLILLVPIFTAVVSLPLNLFLYCISLIQDLCMIEYRYMCEPSVWYGHNGTTIDPFLKSLLKLQFNTECCDTSKSWFRYDTNRSVLLGMSALIMFIICCITVFWMFRVGGIKNPLYVKYCTTNAAQRKFLNENVRLLERSVVDDRIAMPVSSSMGEYDLPRYDTDCIVTQHRTFVDGPSRISDESRLFNENYIFLLHYNHAIVLNCNNYDNGVEGFKRLGVCIKNFKLSLRTYILYTSYSRIALSLTIILPLLTFNCLIPRIDVCRNVNETTCKQVFSSVDNINEFILMYNQHSLYCCLDNVHHINYLNSFLNSLINAFVALVSLVIITRYTIRLLTVRGHILSDRLSPCVEIIKRWYCNCTFGYCCYNCRKYNCFK